MNIFLYFFNPLKIEKLSTKNHVMIFRREFFYLNYFTYPSKHQPQLPHRVFWTAVCKLR